MKKYLLPALLVFLFINTIFSCGIVKQFENKENKHSRVQHKHTVIADSLVLWADSLNIRALDSIQDSTIFYEVRAFRGKLTSKYKKGGNAAMALALIEELEKQKYFAHSRIDTFKGTLFERVPDITLKPNIEIYPWFYVANKANVVIPRNGDTEYKIVTELTNRLGDEFDVDGDVVIFTELPPCNSCSRAIYLFNKKYPKLDVEVLYSPYGRLIPSKKK